MGGGGEGGGRFPTKKLGPIFSETNIQDGVNSIVHFLKRQHRVSGEKKSRLENILYFLLLKNNYMEGSGSVTIK